MAYRAIDHVALRVATLRDAESFYRTLFGLGVLFREASVADGWRTLPAGAEWDDALAAGIDLGLSMLARDGFKLALTAADAAPGAGHLDHVNVEVDGPDLERLRADAPALGCRLAVDRPHVIVIDDPFGVRWEISLPGLTLSTGERTGAWLDIDPAGEPNRIDRTKG